tara:strand:- start:222 stop:461 length:240 start_codon:yes stop_codon:yes gene_type:complete
MSMGISPTGIRSKNNKEILTMKKDIALRIVIPGYRDHIEFCDTVLEDRDASAISHITIHTKGGEELQAKIHSGRMVIVD